MGHESKYLAQAFRTSPSASPGIAAAIRRMLEKRRFREGAQRLAAIIARDLKE